MKTATIESHTFLPQHLSPGATVLDLGANHGRFSMEIIARYGCRCIAVEPSPEVFAVIPEDKQLTKVNCALTAVNGPVLFRVDPNSEASSVVQDSAAETNTISIDGVTLETLCDRLHVRAVSLMKLDIEGAEISVLDSCSDVFLKRIGQITIEFHDFCGLTPPIEIRRVVRRLSRLGFFCIRMSRESYLDTLFVNRSDAGMRWPEFLYLRLIERNWIGLRRMLARAADGRARDRDAR